MQVLHKAFSVNSKSVSSTVKLENGKLFYISTGKGRTSVSKIEAFRIENNMVIHEHGDIMANMNALKSVPNSITRATEKALWSEHDAQMNAIESQLVAKYM